MYLASFKTHQYTFFLITVFHHLRPKEIMLCKMVFSAYPCPALRNLWYQKVPHLKKERIFQKKLLKDTLETCLHGLNAAPSLPGFSLFQLFTFTRMHIYTHTYSSLAHSDSCAQTCNTPFFFYRKVTCMKIKLIKADNASKMILSFL